MNRILITGGAGFIGSHLSDKLISNGYKVKILDNLTDQVHNGSSNGRPSYLNPSAELITGDIRNPIIVRDALKNIDAVFHFAAAVGVGQSMYEIQNYIDVNDIGTAVLLQELIKKPVGKIITASSMSIYGEGLYKNKKGITVEPKERSKNQFTSRKWDLYDSDNEVLTPVPTPETKTPALSSIYALSKYDQERMCLMIGNAYKIPSAALRFFNVYGTRQALSNPYTGVLAIFASRYLNNNPPMIFEDGNQKRDFIHVYDIAEACILALENNNSAGEVFNIGSGNSYTINSIAKNLAQVLNKEEIEPVVSGKYRVGDIRHCFADISKAGKILSFKPKIKLQDGLAELADWLKYQKAEDKVNAARYELDSRGLTV